MKVSMIRTVLHPPTFLQEAEALSQQHPGLPEVQTDEDVLKEEH